MSLIHQDAEIVIQACKSGQLTIEQVQEGEEAVEEALRKAGSDPSAHSGASWAEVINIALKHLEKAGYTVTKYKPLPFIRTDFKRRK